MSETNVDKLKLQADVLELNLKQLKQELEASKCSEQLDKIDLENSYRMSRGEVYHNIAMYGPTFGLMCYEEKYLPEDDCRYNSNNYFHNAEEVKEIIDKINFILKLQRLHNIYCPDYKPDWITQKGNKYYVVFDTKNKEYKWATMDPFYYYFSIPNTVYFPNLETVKKVCAKLNEELKENE